MEKGNDKKKTKEKKFSKKEGDLDPNVPMVKEAGLNVFSYLSKKYETEGSKAEGINLFYEDENLISQYYALDEQMKILFKKLSKKDTTTKTKALQELISSINAKTLEECQVILPTFIYHYKKIVGMIYDRHLRDLAHQIFKIFILKDKKIIKPYLQVIFPFWIISFFDPSIESSQIATDLFYKCFPKENVSNVIKFCSEHYFKFITEYLTYQKDSLIEDLQNSDANEKEDIYERLISSILKSISFICDSVKDGDFFEECKKSIFDLFFGSHLLFPKIIMFKSKKFIKAGIFELISKLIEIFPEETLKYELILSETILNSVSEQNILAQEVLWKNLLNQFIQQFPNCWTHVNITKSFMNKLFQCLRKSGFGAARFLYQNFIIFFSKMPFLQFTEDDLKGLEADEENSEVKLIEPIAKVENSVTNSNEEIKESEKKEVKELKDTKQKPPKKKKKKEAKSKKEKPSKNNEKESQLEQGIIYFPEKIRIIYDIFSNIIKGINSEESIMYIEHLIKCFFDCLLFFIVKRVNLAIEKVPKSSLHFTKLIKKIFILISNFYSEDKEESSKALYIHIPFNFAKFVCELNQRGCYTNFQNEISLFINDIFSAEPDEIHFNFMNLVIQDLPKNIPEFVHILNLVNIKFRENRNKLFEELFKERTNIGTDLIESFYNQLKKLIIFYSQILRQNELHAQIKPYFIDEKEDIKEFKSIEFIFKNQAYIKLIKPLFFLSFLIFKEKYCPIHEKVISKLLFQEPNIENKEYRDWFVWLQIDIYSSLNPFLANEIMKSKKSNLKIDFTELALEFYKFEVPLLKLNEYLSLLLTRGLIGEITNRSIEMINFAIDFYHKNENNQNNQKNVYCEKIIDLIISLILESKNGKYSIGSLDILLSKIDVKLFVEPIFKPKVITLLFQMFNIAFVNSENYTGCWKAFESILKIYKNDEIVVKSTENLSNILVKILENKETKTKEIDQFILKTQLYIQALKNSKNEIQLNIQKVIFNEKYLNKMFSSLNFIKIFTSLLLTGGTSFKIENIKNNPSDMFPNIEVLCMIIETSNLCSTYDTISVKQQLALYIETEVIPYFHQLINKGGNDSLNFIIQIFRQLVHNAKLDIKLKGKVLTYFSKRILVTYKSRTTNLNQDFLDELCRSIVKEILIVELDNAFKNISSDHSEEINSSLGIIQNFIKNIPTKIREELIYHTYKATPQHFGQYLDSKSDSENINLNLNQFCIFISLESYYISKNENEEYSLLLGKIVNFIITNYSNFTQYNIVYALKAIYKIASIEGFKLFQDISILQNNGKDYCSFLLKSLSLGEKAIDHSPEVLKQLGKILELAFKNFEVIKDLAYKETMVQKFIEMVFAISKEASEFTHMIQREAFISLSLGLKSLRESGKYVISEEWLYSMISCPIEQIQQQAYNFLISIYDETIPKIEFKLEETWELDYKNEEDFDFAGVELLNKNISISIIESIEKIPTVNNQEVDVISDLGLTKNIVENLLESQETTQTYEISPSVYSYILSWNALLLKVKKGIDLCRKKGKEDYIQILNTIGVYLSKFQNSYEMFLCLLTSLFPSPDELRLDSKTLLSFNAGNVNLHNKKEVQLLAVYSLFNFVTTYPSFLRQFCMNAKNNMVKQIEKIIERFIAPVIWVIECNTIENNSPLIKSNLLGISIMNSAKEMIASYYKDEIQLTISIKMPSNYPLQSFEVREEKTGLVTEAEFAKHCLLINRMFANQNTDILGVLLLWKANYVKMFEGVAPCPICYSIVHQETFNLPRMVCKTCKNIFHTLCMKKWFKSSHKNKCPLCQNYFW